VKVVVTGGAGFIGANLCRRLARDPDHAVVVVDDLSTGSKKNLRGLDVELAEGTILDTALLDAVFRDADAVVHLAARTSVPRSIEEPVATHAVNATGTMEVLEAARRAGRPHVIVASSSSVYGANPTLPRREDQAVMPMSPYAASKVAAESYALACQRTHELPVLAFRFFNVFGPLQSAGHTYAAVVPAFLAAALAGQPLQIHGDGQQSRDFTFVDTVTELLTDALTRRVTAPEPVNLALGVRTTVLELVHLIEGVVGCPLRIEHVAPRVGDVRWSEGDPTRLRALFPGIQAPALVDALRVTYEWFRSEPTG
jgi:UDP-glucose 4-epimerase